MKNLFIIGNGFDIAHRLPTKYSDFESYLVKEYPNAETKCLIVPESIMMPRGDQEYDDDEVVGFLLKIISETEATGEAWSDLENTLGLLDYDECFDDYSADDDDDDNEWHNVYRNQDIAANLNGAVKMIKKYFAKWIETIDLSGIELKTEFYRMIDHTNDLFLTFNYTETLEEIYEVENVCHLHGMRGGVLIFGHGNDKDYTDEYLSRYIGAETDLSELQQSLRKDTETVIRQNQYFFNKLNAVDKIYSYGFSFSDVDMVYIKEICSVSPTENIVWYIHDFDKEKSDDFKRKIMDCGFKGQFDTFKV